LSTWLIIAVTLAYAFTACSLFANNKVGMGIVFTGYAIANLGFIYDLT
jgi:hypothetical protein